MSGVVYLNGRVPEDWEHAAIEHGRRCEHERDLVLLAGLLCEDDDRAPGVHGGRPVMNVFPGLI